MIDNILKLIDKIHKTYSIEFSIGHDSGKSTACLFKLNWGVYFDEWGHYRMPVWALVMEKDLIDIYHYLEKVCQNLANRYDC